MQLEYSYLNTRRSLHLNEIFLQHWESMTSIYFSTLTPEKNFFRLRLPVKNLRLPRLRLCNTAYNSDLNCFFITSKQLKNLVLASKSLNQSVTLILEPTSGSLIFGPAVRQRCTYILSALWIRHQLRRRNSAVARANKAGGTNRK